LAEQLAICNLAPVLLEVAARDFRVSLILPFDLAEPGSSRPEVGEVHGPGFVMMR